MKKYLFILILPILFAATVVDSTELPFELSKEEQYHLTKKIYSHDMNSIPKNPTVYKEVYSYKDPELTQYHQTIVPNTPLTIVGVEINTHHQQVFRLADSSYILADQRDVFDDVILSQQKIEAIYWSKQGLTLLSSPLAHQGTPLVSDIPPYQALEIDAITETHQGLFAHIKGKGWTSMDNLSVTDNRIEAVQSLLENTYNSDKYSIFVKQLKTNKTAGIYQDKKMYAASVTKLPTLYYAQQQINQGKYSLEEKVRYSKETEEYDGAYEPAGSGSISKQVDDQEYRVDDLLTRIAKESDNVASNIIGYYLANQFDTSFNQEILRITNQKWDMVTREASPKMAGLVMEALYYQGGFVLESLKQTNFDHQRIAKAIPVTVAHKIGDAYEFRHDVALVYTDSPFVLSIFTEQSSYDEITQIAHDIYEILK